MELLKPPIALNPSQYYKAVYPKRFLFLHHTAGGNVSGAISWWNYKPDHVATPFIIGRDGKIYQLFDPKYWSYALGLKGGTDIERHSIQIEIVSWGKLGKRSDNSFYPLTEPSAFVHQEEVLTFSNPYRDCLYYQKYTDAQIASLKELVPYLLRTYGIPIQSDLTNFWFFNKDWQRAPKPGIWSHTTVRLDKSDIFPQKEMVQMIYGLKK
jgi:N-acetyl-anhydromuramyl-L-alanine amidase AmpD